MAAPDPFAPAFARLVAAAEGLPGIAETTSYGTPSLKAGKKMLCRLKDPGTVVLACAPGDKEMLIAAAPEIYFQTPHYRGYPLVLARMAAIGDAELRHRLEAAWRQVATPALHRQRRPD